MSESRNIEAPKVAGEFAPDAYERWTQVNRAADFIESIPEVVDESL